MKYASLLRVISHGEDIQINRKGEWVTMSQSELFAMMSRGEDISWRVRYGRMVQVECDVPAPMVEKPIPGSVYFCANPLNDEGISTYKWYGDNLDEAYFSKGLCYTTAEDARERALAMLRTDRCYRYVDGVDR